MVKTTELVQQFPRWAVVDLETGETLATRKDLYAALAAQRKIERDRSGRGASA